MDQLIDAIKRTISSTGDSTNINMTTLLAGEDVLNDVLKVEHRYTPVSLSQNATLTIIKSTAGLLHAVNIGMTSAPTLTIYDNASGASGTILAHVEPNKPNTYVYDVSFVNGATAWITGGNATIIPVAYR
jgi:hypothetical protein